MVRTVEHVEEERTSHSSSPRERKRFYQKGNALRSKHSETEQRRRIKINEKFQILRDLMPENDQKQDKASLLLEVIQYIQFLHEKLQMYEGSCQACSPDTIRLSPWKINSEPVESFVDQSHIQSLLSVHEDNVYSPTFLSSAKNSEELDLTGDYIQKQTDMLQTTEVQCLPLNMPMQPLTFEVAPEQSHQESLCDAEQCAPQLQSNLWRGSSCGDRCSFPIYATNEEEPKTENGEASISSTCSRRLLNSLTIALQSSGVDLSQANVTVQLDIGKVTNDGSTTKLSDMEDRGNLCSSHPIGFHKISQNHKYPHKRFRAEGNEGH